ncbi:uncharacterized protein LOC105845099 isoform X1 [Hydra vulgaris]|uniref:uncharacterized protein LOC105845099 isoform X1 n=1 Tax=Hydra vulgaris TaxID=6087 RepID=UPI0006418436|nr:uncharacterized protein LOC105845099 [Hydra vulgaris]
MYSVILLVLFLTYRQCDLSVNGNDKNNINTCKNGKLPCKSIADVGEVIQCLDNGTFYIPRGKWGYFSSSGLLETIVCPKSYCKCYIGCEDYCEFDKSKQCSSNREGRLCSECSKGYSVSLFSEECKICNNYWMLLLIPLLILFLFLVVIFLFHFDVDAFSGYLNVYFYWYQMVDIFIPGNTQLHSSTRFLIGFFSLTGTGGTVGLCFFNGMNNLTKLGLNYLPPIFFILIALIFGVLISPSVWIKLFCRSSDKSLNEEQCRKRRESSYGRAMSFVIVVTFSQIITVTLKLLHPVKIDGKFYVFEATFTEFFRDPMHIFLGIIAVCFAIIILLFFVLLIFTPTSGKGKYIAPVFEALKSCFNQSKIIGNRYEECQVENKSYYQRMFAAFYFICRVIMLIISVVVQNEVTKLVFLSLASVTFLTIFSIFQPYRNRSFNYWDISVLFLMCVVSLFCLILSVPFFASENLRNSIKVILQIIVWYPLLSMVFRLVLWKYNQRKRNIKNSSPRIRQESVKSLVSLPVRGVEGM